VDSVPELVWRGYGVVDGLRSLVDVARGSLGGVCSDVFEEVEERWSSMLICYEGTFVPSFVDYNNTSAVQGF